MTFSFKLPDIGEGVVEGEIVKWHVVVGKCAKVGDSILTIEEGGPPGAGGPAAAVATAHTSAPVAHAPAPAAAIAAHPSAAATAAPAAESGQQVRATPAT